MPDTVTGGMNGSTATLIVGFGDDNAQSILILTESASGWKPSFVPTSAYVNKNYGTNVAYWLGGNTANNCILYKRFAAALFRCDPRNVKKVWMCGKNGMFTSDDLCKTVYPAGMGFGGSEASSVKHGATENEWLWGDTDWHACGSKDAFVTEFHGGTTPPNYGSSYSVTVGKNAWKLNLSTPPTITLNGKDVGDDYFRSACTCPQGIAASPGGDLAIALYGGGILFYHDYTNSPLYP
jgi:hypothetical protein